MRNRKQLHSLLIQGICLGIFLTGLSFADELTQSSPPTVIQKVISAGYMNLYADGKFHEASPLTRAELATILDKVFDLGKREVITKDLPLIEDVPESHWAYSAIQKVLKTHIMEGYRQGKFYPNQKINRSEGFSIFAQAYGIFPFQPEMVTEILSEYKDSTEIPDWARNGIATTLHDGLMNTQQKELHPLAPMTRGDMAYALAQYLERGERGNPINNPDQ